MNTQMLTNEQVVDNIEALEASSRFTILSPDEGELACGVVGPGRLPDADQIVAAARAVLTPKDLAGIRVTVSAGPTIEDLDPVRFLSNRSTGTMGFELARSLHDRGAHVTLLAGPVALQTPPGVTRVDVRSAEDLARAVDAAWPATDALVMAAAVADYRPTHRVTSKLKKTQGPMSLELERTPDVLGTVAGRADRAGKLLIGFAAETEEVNVRAREKLAHKDLDWIVANDVSGSGAGFGTGDNAGVLLARGGEEIMLSRRPKADFADAIVDALSESLRGLR